MKKIENYPNYLIQDDQVWSIKRKSKINMNGQVLHRNSGGCWLKPHKRGNRVRFRLTNQEGTKYLNLESLQAMAVDCN